jgi:diguanylate cyclase (GGDEF)-like protein
MQKHDIPQNEETRLKNLRSLNILNTSQEERFDRLTRLAKRMFDVPIALVSLVDENRQWFKSCDGLNVQETPRDISFCGHAILGDEVFIIPDTIKDERFADNPLVLNEPHIRFYAGCPLRYLDGSKLGTLCIINTEPKILNDEDIESLKDLAELAERELNAVQLATLDELTKISNRRGFTVLAQKSLDLCIRQKISASLIFIDINDFKSINDNFGHAEGDKALIVFAEQMIHTFRESDVFGRLGGDEFVALLTNTSIEQAEEITTRFRQSIAEYCQENTNKYDISFSHGIVSIDFEAEHSIETLLNKADSIMYENKPSDK